MLHDQLSTIQFIISSMSRITGEDMIKSIIAKIETESNRPVFFSTVSKAYIVKGHNHVKH